MTYIHFSDPALYGKSISAALDDIYARLYDQAQRMGLPRPSWVLVVGSEQLRVALWRVVGIDTPVYVSDKIPENDIWIVEEQDLRVYVHNEIYS